MRLGLIRPDFPGERRVALLPQDMRTSENHLVIDEKFGDLVDLVIDGGIGGTEFSTIVDCTSGEIEVIRQGKGWLNEG